MRILFAAIALAMLASACSGDGSKTAATASSTATDTPAATGTTTTDVTSTPSQTSAIATYPPETRTGIDALDQISVSVLAADTNDVGARLAYVEVPCAAPDKPLPGPQCPSNAAVGTMVSAFLLTGCESSWESKDLIGPVVKGFVVAGLQLFAVYRVDAARGSHLAPGDFGLVFVDPRLAPLEAGAGMVAVTVDSQGRIVHWAGSCGTTEPAAFMYEQPVSGYVLPPRPSARIGVMKNSRPAAGYATMAEAIARASQLAGFQVLPVLNLPAGFTVSFFDATAFQPDGNGPYEPPSDFSYPSHVQVGVSSESGVFLVDESSRRATDSTDGIGIATTPVGEFYRFGPSESPVKYELVTLDRTFTIWAAGAKLTQAQALDILGGFQ